MDQQQIAVGTEVRSADDEKLGSVVSVEQGYLVVEKGFFFPTDYYVPVSAVANYDGQTAYLNVDKSYALSSGWDKPGAATATTTTTSTQTTGYETSGLETSGYEATAATADATMTTAATTRTDLTDQDRIVVPVHEEELAAVKREREAGEVVIRKDVVAEERTLEVPITEERVSVTRRAVNREGAVDANAFTEETIEVPLTTQEVELQKRVRVAEEVEIDKEAVQTTEAVTGTVRREVVDVDETTAVETQQRTYTETTGTGQGGQGLVDRAVDAVQGATGSTKRG